METQVLNDGIVTIYRSENIADVGDMPKWNLVKTGALRYHRRTIGVQRLYLAKQANAQVDLLLRCQYRPEVKAGNVAVPTQDGEKYKITVIQIPEDIYPPVMDLTLEKLEGDDEDAG